MKTIYDNFGFYSVLMATVSLPFSYSVSSLFLVILFMSILFNPYFYKEFSFPNIKSVSFWVIVLSYVFFLFYLFGYSYSEDIAMAKTELSIKIPFILFPLLIIYKNRIIKNNLDFLLLGFLAGGFLNTIYILYLAFSRSFYYLEGHIYSFLWDSVAKYNWSTRQLFSSGVSEFTYGRLSHFFHPAYLAMYLTFSIAIIFYFLKTSSFKKQFIRNFLKGLIVFYSIVIVLLNSRAGIISLSFIIFLSIYLQIFQYKKYVSGVLYSIIFTSLISFSLTYSRMKKNKVYSKVIVEQVETQNILSNGTKQKGQKRKTKFGSSTPRLAIWSSAIEELKQNWLWGVGIGDIKNAIYKQDYVKKLRPGVHKYDSHNQFIQTFLGVGVFGFIVLLSFLFIPYIWALKSKRYLLFSHLSIVLINSLVESVFSRSYGVLFFSLFFYLFLAYNPNYKDHFLSFRFKN